MVSVLQVDRKSSGKSTEKHSGKLDKEGYALHVYNSIQLIWKKFVFFSELIPTPFTIFNFPLDTEYVKFCRIFAELLENTYTQLRKSHQQHHFFQTQMLRCVNIKHRFISC